MGYSPSTFWVWVLSKFVAALRTVIVAFLTTAPFESFTETWSSAEATCAIAVPPNINTASTSANCFNVLIILYSLSRYGGVSTIRWHSKQGHAIERRVQ